MDFGEVEGLEAGKGGEVEEEWKESVFSAGFPPTTDISHLHTTEPRKPMNTTLEVDSKRHQKQVSNLGICSTVR